MYIFLMKNSEMSRVKTHWVADAVISPLDLWSRLSFYSSPCHRPCHCPCRMPSVLGEMTLPQVAQLSAHTWESVHQDAKQNLSPPEPRPAGVRGPVGSSGSMPSSSRPRDAHMQDLLLNVQHTGNWNNAHRWRWVGWKERDKLWHRSQCNCAPNPAVSLHD